MTLDAFLLADGRFPAGGHVHSAGVEAAVADGRVHDEDSLVAYMHGRLLTAGLTDAALAVATTTRVRAAGAREERAVVLLALDAEAGARVPAPPLREASRRLGRQLVRAAARCWPSVVLSDAAGLLPDGPHQPCALGLVGCAAGLAADEVARVAVHHAIATPGQAGVRLLGLDPFAVVALAAGLAADGEAVVREALTYADAPLADLPARTGPMVEIAAMEHAQWDVRMFTT